MRVTCAVGHDESCAALGRLRLLLSANEKTLLNSMRPFGRLVQDSAPGSGIKAKLSVISVTSC